MAKGSGPRPRGVSGDARGLLPEGRALPVCCGSNVRTHTPGEATALLVDLAWVLEQLRWLPDTEFETCVARVAEATGGQRWSAWDASYHEGAPVWQEVRITRGEAVLTGGVDWSRQGVTERLLRSWPRGG